MGIPEQLWSRRKFVTTLTGAGTLVVMNPPLMWAFEETTDPRIAAIVAETMGIDTHNHVDVPLNAAGLPGPAVDLKGEMIKSGLSALCMTFAVDYQKLANPGDAYIRFSTGLDAMDKVLESNGVTRSLNIADLENAKKKKVPTVIQSVEGCHFLEGQVDRVAVAYKRGLRHLGLLHDNDASVPLGDVYTNPAKFGGLTTFGADVIKECNRLGILIDLAHASNDTLNAAIKVTTKPFIISHTGLDTQLGQNPMMAKMMRPRLISKEQAKIVANAGGIIGVWTHLADTPDDFAKNVRAMIDVVGIDHVCIGTDTKMTPSYRPPGDAGFRPDGTTGKPGEKQNNGTPEGKQPEQKKTERPGERTNYAWQGQDTGFYYTVVAAMLKAGFTEDEITKIGGGNFCRVFAAATKG
jgi:membrane dipeptidase